MNTTIMERKELEYGKMLDNFYEKLRRSMVEERFIADGEAFTLQNLDDPGQCRLVKIMLNRIKRGRALLVQEKDAWYFRFSGTRPLYESSPFPFYREIFLAYAWDKESWSFSYAIARRFAKAFRVRLHIHKQRETFPPLRCSRELHYPFFPLPLPA